MRETRGPLPLVVRDLAFRAGGRTLLDAVSLDISSRGPTVIMGPNGAGKSLLVRLLHGLIEPEVGSISWNGQRQDADMRKRQAMVFQKPVLLRRSVAANVDFVLSLRPRPQADRDSLLREAGLDRLAAQPARALSGGEQQRLALVRAVAMEPEVLFLDEPCASLDPASVLEIEAQVRAVATRGIKVILVTHDRGQARRLADDVVFLQSGKLMEHTPADRFFTRPESLAARAYLAGDLLV